MHFERNARLNDVVRITLAPFTDNRGKFARVFCAKEFKKHGLPTNMVQANLSFNDSKGTLRGLHFQRAPSEEGKLISCLRGAIYDVIIDVRADSPTYLTWEAFELDEEDETMLFIPPGFAHGFLTMRDNTLVHYMMSEYYEPELGAGLRWNDPKLGIDWPLSNPIISEKDANFPDLV